MNTPRAALLGLTLGLAMTGCSNTTEAETATDSGSTTAGLKSAKWGSNVTISFANGKVRYQSNGLPNHARQAEYALPNAGVRVPNSQNAHAGADPTRQQSYDFQIPATPTRAASPTDAPLGTIGVMISGAALFNPYEGDGVTVAAASNFTVKNTAGQDIAFLDACSGHPNPMGAYHYHGLPACVTATVDVAGGPSHIIGLAFDGYPIYGDRDMNGQQVTAARLDRCNGITSPTPEFPEGIYHYVLLGTADATSSIRCFTGVVDPTLLSMGGMHAPRP